MLLSVGTVLTQQRNKEKEEKNADKTEKGALMRSIVLPQLLAAN